MKKIKPAGVVIFLVLCVLGAVMVFPVYMAVLNSFKEQGEMFKSVLAFPQHFTLNNYVTVFKKINVLRSIGNTFIITTVSLAGILAFSSMAGYKLSRTPGKLSFFLFLFFTSSMLIPFHSIMITLVKITSGLHLQGTKLGLILIYIGVGVNLPIFLYHGFVKTIPIDVEESAFVDGCTEFQTFMKIILPLLAPITATISIIDVLWMWNDFFLPMLILTNMKNFTLVLSSYMFADKYNTEWSNILATLVFTAVPVVVFYLFFQKYIVEGITAGAVKG